MSKAATAARVVAFYVALLALWQGIFEAGVWSPAALPEPASVASALRRFVQDGSLFESMAATMARMLIGFALAAMVGTAVGLACGSVRWLNETLGSLVLGMQSLPSISWLPVAVLWFGKSQEAIVFIVVLGSVWAIAISARDGVRNIPLLQRRAAQVFGAGRGQTLRYVTLPGMLPSMAQGLKLGWSFSWRSLMAGELIFVTAGLGHLMQVGRDAADMSVMLAVMAVIVALGLAFDRLVFGPLDAWVRHRWGLAG